MVDITRLSLYSSHIGKTLEGDTRYILLTAILAAFAGAFIGNRLLKKTTMEGIKDIVTALLILMSIALAAGLI
jgi:uncharacterized membrane protein YfcA